MMTKPAFFAQILKILPSAHYRERRGETSWELSLRYAFHAENDPELVAMGVEMEAVTCKNTREHLQNRIRFWRGSEFGEVTCIHTARLMTAADIERGMKDNVTIGDWGRDNLQPKDFAPMTTNEGDLISIADHFIALCSWVGAVADMGFKNLLCLSCQKHEDASDLPLMLPFGFNSAMQTQMLRALQLIGTPASYFDNLNLLMVDLLGENPAWFVSRFTLLNQNYNFLGTAQRNKEFCEILRKAFQTMQLPHLFNDLYYDYLLLHVQDCSQDNYLTLNELLPSMLHKIQEKISNPEFRGHFGQVTLTRENINLLLAQQNMTFTTLVITMRNLPEETIRDLYVASDSDLRERLIEAHFERPGLRDFFYEALFHRPTKWRKEGELIYKFASLYQEVMPVEKLWQLIEGDAFNHTKYAKGLKNPALLEKLFGHGLAHYNDADKSYNDKWLYKDLADNPRCPASIYQSGRFLEIISADLEGIKSLLGNPRRKIPPSNMKVLLAAAQKHIKHGVSSKYAEELLAPITSRRTQVAYQKRITRAYEDLILLCLNNAQLKQSPGRYAEVIGSFSNYHLSRYTQKLIARLNIIDKTHFRSIDEWFPRLPTREIK